MKPLKRYAPWIVLVLLPIVGLYATYWLLFCMWRSAADPTNSAMWRFHIYGSVALCISLVVLFVRLLFTYSGLKAGAVRRWRAYKSGLDVDFEKVFHHAVHLH